MRVICDYSLQHVKSRPAAVGDKLIVHNFGLGTRGFAQVGGDCNTAICLLPGTELAFDNPVQTWAGGVQHNRVARFRQVDKGQLRVHHDALEFPDGTQWLLTHLTEGQTATVLQLPAAPKTKAEAEEQRRAEYVG